MKNIPKILKAMFVVFFTLQILFYSQLHASKVDVAKLDHYIDHIQQSNNSMFSVSIMEKGNPVYLRSIGYADPMFTIRSRADTKYRMGELSKIFTTVIFMQMVDEKMIQLGTPLSRFFPEIPNGRHISLQDLLSEKLNIIDYLIGGKYYHAIKSEYAFEQLLLEDNIAANKASAMNNHFTFNNANYLILGLVIEKITGKTYKEVVKQRIADPLGLENTYDGSTLFGEKNEACSFESLNGEFELSGQWDLNSIAASGSIISTPHDMGKLMDALFRGKLVSDKSLKNILIMNNGKGLGIVEIPFSNRIGFGNMGRIDGFVSQTVYFPSDSICISFSMNANSLSNNDLMNELVKIIYGS